MQSEKAVSAYFPSNHILPLGFAEQYERHILTSKVDPRAVRVESAVPE